MLRLFVENLLNIIRQIRNIFPYYSIDNIPNSDLVSTVHVGLIKGGEASNQIASYAEAILDFRIVESENVDSIIEKIKNSLNKDVSFEILASTNPIIRNAKDLIIQKYQKSMHKIINASHFENYDCASDGRFFHDKGAILITHQANCGNFHSAEEWIDLKSLYQFQKIQLDFLINFNK